MSNKYKVIVGVWFLVLVVLVAFFAYCCQLQPSIEVGSTADMWLAIVMWTCLTVILVMSGISGWLGLELYLFLRHVRKSEAKYEARLREASQQAQHK